MKIRELMQETKNALGIDSDGELARSLGINKGRVSEYCNGTNSPNEFICLRISEITGKPLDHVIAIVRANSEKDEKRREAWENYMKRLGGLAASLFGFMVFLQSGFENAIELAMLSPRHRVQDRNGLV